VKPQRTSLRTDGSVGWADKGEHFGRAFADGWLSGCDRDGVAVKHGRRDWRKDLPTI